VTVQEVCDKLKDLQDTRLSAFVEGLDAISNLSVPEALELTFLDPSVLAVFEAYSRSNSRDDEMIGSMEINAFMAAFQKAYQNENRTRITRWSRIVSAKKKLVSENGPLAAQLRHIGVKVEDEFLTRIMGLTDV